MNGDLRVLSATLWLFSLATIGACGAGKEGAPTTAPASNTPAASETSTAAPGPTLPAPAVTQAAWAPDALEELLAPIALYPDQLLSQILAASVNAQEVLDAGNWLLENQTLTGNALDAAARKAGFGPATRALVQFPTVVDMMCQQIDWTRQIGAAFTSDQKSVLDAVQRLRTQAAAAGNLKSTPQQTVEANQEDQKVIVEVQPADPKVVYVPQYDPQAVYTTPPPPAPAPSETTSNKDTVSTGAAVAGGLLAFGVGVVLGHAMDDHDDYCYPQWGTGAIYYGPRPFYPPAYVYRPVYGPAFHPAYRYAPPPGYRHSYNRVDVDVNRNIVVNNDNYFNRFDNNRNLNVDAAARPAATRPRTPANTSEEWRGKSTYAGARKDAADTNVAARAQAENRAPRADQQRQIDRAQDHAQDRTKAIEGRDGQRDLSARTEESAAPRDRDVKPATTQDLDTARARQRPQQPDDDATPHDHVFAGANAPDAGSLERAASARGNASAGIKREHVARSPRRR